MSAPEREWLAAELAREEAELAQSGHWTLRRALTHPRILGLAAIYGGIAYGLYALGFFLPSIVAGFQQQYGTHYSVVQLGITAALAGSTATATRVTLRQADFQLAGRVRRELSVVARARAASAPLVTKCLVK